MSRRDITPAMEQEVVALYETMGIAQIIEETGITKHHVTRILRSHRVGMRHCGKPPTEQAPPMTFVSRAERNTAIRDMRRQGIPIDDIGRMVGLRTNTIRAICLETKNKRGPYGSHEEHKRRNAKIARDYEAGALLLDLAEEHGISVGRISQIIAKETGTYYGRKCPFAHNDAEFDYEAGVPLREICIRYGGPPGRLKSYLRSCGVILRPEDQ